MIGAALDLWFEANIAYVSGHGHALPRALLTTTRSSTSDYAENTSGIWTAFAAGVPRITNKGLLVEEARTNVVLWNRDLTDVAWTASNITAAKDQTGVDGVASSASSITATSDAGTITQAITLASSARWQSVFVKRLVGAGTLEMSMDGGTSYTTITPSGTAWQRKEIATQTLANPEARFRIGTNGDSFAVDFVQNENSSVCGTSPIAVTTVAVARSADVIAVTGLTIGAAATLYAEATTGTQTTGAIAIAALSDGDTNERMMLWRNGTTPSGLVVNGGATQASVTNGTWAANTTAKIVMAGTANDFAFSFNGGAVQTDVSGTWPVMTRLGLGNNGATGSQPNGYLRRVAYFPARLSNAQLQALTT